MTSDRTTKVLLALILVALCALLIRGEVTPAFAQSQLAPNANAVAISSPALGAAFVVSRGKISYWENDNSTGTLKLKMYDSKPLPK